jgi:hypothetical protein
MLETKEIHVHRWCWDLDLAEECWRGGISQVQRACSPADAWMNRPMFSPRFYELQNPLAFGGFWRQTNQWGKISTLYICRRERHLVDLYVPSAPAQRWSVLEAAAPVKMCRRRNRVGRDEKVGQWREAGCVWNWRMEWPRITNDSKTRVNYCSPCNSKRSYCSYPPPLFLCAGRQPSSSPDSRHYHVEKQCLYLLTFRNSMPVQVWTLETLWIMEDASGSTSPWPCHKLTLMSLHQIQYHTWIPTSKQSPRGSIRTTETKFSM